MSALKLALAAAILGLPLGAAAHAQPMTATPIPYANPDNAKDTSSKASREAAREKQKKAEAAKKAHKPEKPDQGKKTPDANSPG